MAESLVQVTEGSGKKLHTWQRTIGANNVEDEFIIPGEYPLASYVCVTGNVLTATANSHLLQLMAGASLPVRIRRILVRPGGTLPAAVTRFPIQVFRLTTAGTGGGTVTPRPHDTTEAAAGAVGMTLPTAKGTEGVGLDEENFWFNTAAIPGEGVYEWVEQPRMKPLIIPAGTANGIALKNPTALATASVTCTIWFVETSFV